MGQLFADLGAAALTFRLSLAEGSRVLAFRIGNVIHGFQVVSSLHRINGH